MSSVSVDTAQLRPDWLPLDLPNRHPAWWFAGVAFALCAVGFLLLTFVDARELSGVSVWTKPIKFAVSLSVYFLTLAWFAPLMGRDYFASGVGRGLTWIALTCACFEMIYIALQAALGEHSHFNVGTTYHAVMYSLMGFGAVTLVSVCLWLGCRLLRRNGLQDPYVFAVGLGLVLTFVLGGTLGGYLSSQSGHWVGGTLSDANTLPGFHWSRDGGDLRVAHFWGIHAMQIVPLLVWPLRLRSSAAGIAWALTVACALTAFTLVTFRQALAGLPFLG